MFRHVILIYICSQIEIMKTTPEHNAKFPKLIFADVYPYYVKKIEAKGRTISELHQVISWLTGYDETRLEELIADRVNFQTFFDGATLHPNAHLITGVICGYRVEELLNPLTQNARRMDKLIDELAKGKTLAKILRT